MHYFSLSTGINPVPAFSVRMELLKATPEKATV
jgi:hypothetical protein